MENILYQRIRKLCSDNGITIAKLELDLHFGANSIRKWQKSSPSIDKILKVANYFDVSTDFLLGRPTNVSYDKDIISFQRAHQKMSIRDREKMMQILRLGFEDAFSDQ